MNIASLEDHATLKLLEWHAEHDNPEALREFYRNQARDFGDKYTRARKGFGLIMEAAGYVMQPGAIQESNPIIIKRDHEVDGMGRSILQATISFGAQPMSTVKTNFQLKNDGKIQDIAREELTTVGDALFGGHPFADDPSGSWIDNPESFIRTPGYVLGKIGKTILPLVEQALETQTLLRQAMQDPRLNNGMALAARAAFSHR